MSYRHVMVETMNKGDQYLALHDSLPKHRQEARSAPAAPSTPMVTLVRELATEQQLRTLAGLCKQATGKWPSASLSKRWQNLDRGAAKVLIEAYRTEAAK